MRKAAGESVGANRKRLKGFLGCMGSAIIFFLMAVLFMAPTVSLAQGYGYERGSCVGWTYTHVGLISGEDQKCTEDGSNVQIDKTIDVNGSNGKAEGEASNLGTHRGKLLADASGRLNYVMAWTYTWTEDIFIVGKSDPDAPDEGTATVCYSLSGEIKNIDKGYVNVWLDAEANNEEIIEYYEDVEDNKSVSSMRCGTFKYDIESEIYYSENLSLMGFNHVGGTEPGKEYNGHAEAVNFTAVMKKITFPEGHFLAYTASGKDYPPKRVTLLNPNGGINFHTDQTTTIMWETDGGTAFLLQYSVNKGLTWKPVYGDFIYGTSYDWEIPNLTKNTTKALVKVTAFSDTGGMIGSDKSDTPFAIDVVEVTGPNGGETYSSGEGVVVGWETYETKRPVYKVRLLYTLNNGATWKAFPAAEQPVPGADVGFHLVHLPNVTMNKYKCKLKVVLLDRAGNGLGSDVSDGVFTILKQL